MVREFDLSDPNPTRSDGNSTQIINEEGGIGYAPEDPETELYKKVINNLLEDTFYETVEESYEDIREAFDAVAGENPQFPLQLATYARHSEGLRDIPQLLLVMSANDERTKEYVRPYAPSIIDRTDEFCTVLAFQFGLHGPPTIDGRIELFLEEVAPGIEGGSSLSDDVTLEAIEDQLGTDAVEMVRELGKPVPKPLKRGLEDALHERWALVEVDAEELSESEVQRVTYVEPSTDDGYPIEADALIRAEEAVFEDAGVDVDAVGDHGEIVDSGYVHDEYTCTKYRNDSADVSLVDVINLVRPNPRSDNRNELFRKIAYGELDETSSFERDGLESNLAWKDHWSTGLPEHVQDVEPLRNDRTWEAERSSETTTVTIDVGDLDGVLESLSVDDVLYFDPEAGSGIVEWEYVDDDTVEVEIDLVEADEWRHRLDDMGVMARVRNVRNMLEVGLSGEEIFDYDVPDAVHLDGPAQIDVFGENSAEIVRNSQQFPFRYYQAFKALDGTKSPLGGYFDISSSIIDDATEEWLSEAMNTAVENLPDSLEDTFVAVDLSGSMNSPVSSDSTLDCAEIASLFGACLLKRNSDVGVFATDFALVEIDEQTRESESVLELATRIYETGSRIGGGTNGHKALEWAIQSGESYERFVYFTDLQMWDSESFGVGTGLKEVWDTYSRNVAPEASLYTIDLNSYGDFSMPQNDVHQISGWSGDVVEFIDRQETIEDVVSDIASIESVDY